MAPSPIPIIDADTHVTEPVDLWAKRLPTRFRDDAPLWSVQASKFYAEPEGIPRAC